MSTFPTYNDSKGTEKEVNQVEKDFKWAFRMIHLEDDFGIDGYLVKFQKAEL